MAVKEFNYQKLEKLSITYDLLNMLTKIHEYKGKQELYITTKPEILNKLTDLALIQSTEASNKIEGIATTDGRLKQLVEEKVKPRNRDEEEIAGYRDVLKLIHDSYEYIRVVPNDILTLHKNLYNYSAKSYKGKFKSGDNVITEKDIDGNERVRFVPAPPKEEASNSSFTRMSLRLCIGWGRLMASPFRFRCHETPYFAF